MTSFQEALWLDCRIAAFGIGQTIPDLIFIDLDDKDFCSRRAIKMALTKTLKRIKKKLNGYPTVYRSGRGYHIIQPIRCPVNLDEIKEFAALTDRPNNEFLQFAEQYLTGNKSDAGHNPAMRSCMLRVPGSLNSRCKEAGIDAELKIIQRWDGHRSDYRLLIGSFYADLRGRTKKKEQQQQQFFTPSVGSIIIPWIERVLSQTPIEDFRKTTIGLILSRYLINVKKLNYNQAHAIIWEWLDKCQQLRRLEPSRSYFDRYVVRYQLKEAQRNKRWPMKLETLKEKYHELYKQLYHFPSITKAKSTN
jgi:hypothetical protein